MDDKVFLTKRQKNKLKTLRAISVIAFYMFFAYTMPGNEGGLKKREKRCIALLLFVVPVAELSWRKEMRKRKKTLEIRK